MRFGVRTFWASETLGPPALHLSEALPVAGLLLASVLLTVQAQPVFAYLARIGADIHRPALYIDAVRSAPSLPGPVTAKEAP